MKTLTGILLVLAAVIPGINDIARVNKLKKEAESAFLAGDYGKASEAYTYLTDSLGLNEDEVFMNLGHSFFRQGDSASAFSQYQRLVTSPNKALKSSALNQMGIISNKPGDRASALNYFKEALKANPASEEARYNYQLVKRQIDEEKEQNQDQQQEKENEEQKQDEQQQEKQDQQQKSDQQNQEQKDQEQQQKDQESEDKEQKDQEKKDPKQESKEKPEDQKKQEQEAEQKENDKKDGKEQPQQINPDKLKEMNISEEKARMILEAMRNSEIQYIQQNKRKATKKPESGKPDW
jgi:Ca-activated chloride channel family protein